LNALGINFDNDNPTHFDFIRFTVGLTSGGSPVDFSQTTMAYSAQNYTGVKYLNMTDKLPTLNPASVTGNFVKANVTPGKWGVVLINNGDGKTDLLLENQEQFVIYANPGFPLVANEKFNLEISPAVGTSYVVARKAPARVEKVSVLY